MNQAYIVEADVQQLEELSIQKKDGNFNLMRRPPRPERKVMMICNCLPLCWLCRHGWKFAKEEVFLRMPEPPGGMARNAKGRCICREAADNPAPSRLVFLLSANRPAPEVWNESRILVSAHTKSLQPFYGL